MPPDLVLAPALVIAGATSLLWVVSVWMRDASIVDIWWGPGFAVIAWVVVGTVPEPPPRLLLVAGLLTLWALRLSIYLAARNLGHAEDRRYQALRGNRAGIWWSSLVTVFFLQGGLQVLIATPLFAVAGTPGPLAWSDLLFALVVLAGIGMEAVADQQLAAFKKKSRGEATVLRTGVWGWCRHPNYFGNALMWLGLGALALSGGGPLWASLGPAVMWFLLLKVSGVSLLESTITERRPAYREYIQQVPAFFPNPFRGR